ncbi:hypothetical protein HDU93_007512 [Gonapodya sp. JEL0774]|nr:hypothetical protein HDU93_007512 [Gonapodya sp. JEL0774]
MGPQPISDQLPGPSRLQEYKGADKLKDKVALITGAHLVEEQKDTNKIKKMVEKKESACLMIPCDVAKGVNECRRIVDKVVESSESGGKIHDLVNNAAVQGDSIITTTSVTAYKGSPSLLDYSSTKGAMVAFTRSLHQRGFRVNLWPPGRYEKSLKKWTSEGAPPLWRIGEPAEVATSYVLPAAADGSYFSGQVLHPNGGDLVNGAPIMVEARVIKVTDQKVKEIWQAKACVLD